MRDLLFTLSFGLMGLSLTLAFPSLRIDWLALVLAGAFLRRDSVPAWFGLAALSCLYSVFSMASAWEIACPFAVSVLIFGRLRKNFSMGGLPARGLLIAFFCASSWLAATLGIAVAGFPFSLKLGDVLWSVATLAMGILGIPAFRWLLSLGWGRLSRWSRSGARLASNSPWLGEGASRFSRKPFGLEKGF